MVTKIKNGLVATDAGFVETDVYIADGKINCVTTEKLSYDACIDAGGNYVTAGFIDMHCHGGGGADFNDGSESAVLTAARTHLEHGTTSLFPTVTSSEFKETVAALKTIGSAREKAENLMPPHLEGPYFSPRQTGAQNGNELKSPDSKEYLKIMSDFDIARWDYAPELDTDFAFLNALNAHGIVAAAGHTDATIRQMREAALKGCRLITHLYSCTSTIKREHGFRIAGVTEAAYLYDDIDVEIIADGKHLPEELIQLVYKYKGKGKAALITDAIRAAGTELKEAYTGKSGTGVKCIIEDGVAKLPDRSAFAGSVATAEILVRTCKNAGIPLFEAVKMITEVPAKIMKLKNKGKISVGYDADFVVFDENINVKNVILKGKII